MSIEVSQGLVPATANTPLDARTRVATLDDVAAIPLAYVGMEFYCIATGKRYVVKSLKAKTVGALTVPDMLINQYDESNGSIANVFISSDTMLAVNTRYTVAASCTLTLPAAPVESDTVTIQLAGNVSSCIIVAAATSATIEGDTTFAIDIARGAVTLIYQSLDDQWVVTSPIAPIGNVYGAATTATAGVVRLASNVEIAEGTASDVAVTPANVRSMIDTAIGLVTTQLEGI